MNDNIHQASDHRVPRTSFYEKRSYRRLYDRHELSVQNGRMERLKKIKAERKCRACGQLGHCFRPRRECVDKMMDRDFARSNINGAAAVIDESPPKMKVENRQANEKFRPGVQ